MTIIKKYYELFSEYLIGVRMSADCIACTQYDSTKRCINCQTIPDDCPGVVLDKAFRKKMMTEVESSK
jgi:hypothetical protein